MKIVIAPDSFKESLSSAAVCEAISAGIRARLPESEIICVPVADGGEGTLDALIAATRGRSFGATVTGPLPEMRVHAAFGLLGDGDTAVIEMARASGLELLPAEQRNPLKTTSFGTGELILAALDQGVKQLIIAIGGSATNDGGVGMMQALGVRFMDEFGYEIGLGGEALTRMVSIDCSNMDPRLAQVSVVVACDVDNPLIGTNGASAVFGPQKGATPEMVTLLDNALAQYAAKIKQQLGVSVAHYPGAGAAGGLGAALLAFFDATLKPGIDIVTETVALKDIVEGADWVITGEGRVDGQTLGGKTPAGVARIARSQEVPVVILAGSLGEGCEKLADIGVAACFSVLSSPCTLPQALAEGDKNLRSAAYQLAGLLECLN